MSDIHYNNSGIFYNPYGIVMGDCCCSGASGTPPPTGSGCWISGQCICFSGFSNLTLNDDVCDPFNYVGPKSLSASANPTCLGEDITFNFTIKNESDFDWFFASGATQVILRIDNDSCNNLEYVNSSPSANEYIYSTNIHYLYWYGFRMVPGESRNYSATFRNTKGCECLDGSKVWVEVSHGCRYSGVITCCSGSYWDTGCLPSGNCCVNIGHCKGNTTCNRWDDDCSSYGAVSGYIGNCFSAYQAPYPANITNCFPPTTEPGMYDAGYYIAGHYIKRILAKPATLAMGQVTHYLNLVRLGSGTNWTMDGTGYSNGARIAFGWQSYNPTSVRSFGNSAVVCWISGCPVSGPCTAPGNDPARWYYNVSMNSGNTSVVTYILNVARAEAGDTISWVGEKYFTSPTGMRLRQTLNISGPGGGQKYSRTIVYYHYATGEPEFRLLPLRGCYNYVSIDEAFSAFCSYQPKICVDNIYLETFNFDNCDSGNCDLGVFYPGTGYSNPF